MRSCKSKHNFYKNHWYVYPTKCTGHFIDRHYQGKLLYFKIILNYDGAIYKAKHITMI